MRGERRAFQAKAQQVGRCRWEGSSQASESGSVICAVAPEARRAVAGHPAGPGQ